MLDRLKQEMDKERLFQKQITYTIPLNIFQCWHSDELPNSLKESIENIKTNNPEFLHHLYNDKTCRAFIQSNFEEDVLYAYDSLVPHALRIDLWRYCILYKYGGIYLDVKYQCIHDFKFIYLVDQEYFCQDLKESGLGIYNAILICNPNNKVLLRCIHKIVENVKNEFYGKNGLEISGPMMIKPILSDYVYELNLFHRYTQIENDMFFYICYHTFPILQINVDYRKDQKEKGEVWSEHYYKRTVYRKILDSLPIQTTE